MSNKEVWSELHIAVYAVTSHVHNALEKLALHTRLATGQLRPHRRHGQTMLCAASNEFAQSIAERYFETVLKDIRIETDCDVFVKPEESNISEGDSHDQVYLCRDGGPDRGFRRRQQLG